MTAPEPLVTDLPAPADEAELCDLLASAVAQREPLEIVGRGSKRALGRPVSARARLNTARLSGLIDYAPAELVVSARPATPLREIEALLAAQHQMLAFEPPDYRALLNAPATSEPSLGGAIACNLAGPRRFRAGAARDHLLGFRAVSGRAEPFKSGGRVMKNVTGYDLSKLMAGSYGTLAVLTELSVKVVPVPEAALTMLLFGLDEQAAQTVFTVALGSPHDVSGAAFLPAPEAAALGLGAGSLARAGSVLGLRLEGFAPAVAARRDALAILLGPFGRAQISAEAEARALWQAVRDVGPFAGARDTDPVWRLSLPPARAAELAAALRNKVPGARLFFDWGGGLIWLAVPATTDAGEPLVRRAVHAVGGHAMLVRASVELRTRLSVFEPQDSALGALTRRLKAAFDPEAVLNPGRLFAEA
jgi:glycolate oxidase FAD binding subunit